MSMAAFTPWLPAYVNPWHEPPYPCQVRWRWSAKWVTPRLVMSWPGQWRFLSDGEAAARDGSRYRLSARPGIASGKRFSRDRRRLVELW